jgi:CRP-like cAMP-binding protein/ATP/ADP translocase/HEAT repeat protein
LKHRLSQFLNLEPGEEKLVGCALLQSVFIGLPRLFTLTVASALFLERFSASNLPYVYIAGSVIVPLVGFLHLNIGKRLSFQQHQTGTFLALAVFSLAFLAILLLSDASWPIFLLLVWYDVEWSMLNLAFWGTANRVFTVRQGKRLFGLIGNGEVLAQVAGGLLTPVLVGLVGTRSLLGISFIGHCFAVGIFIYITRAFKEEFKEEIDTASENQQASQGFFDLFKSRYALLIMASYFFCAYISYYFVDNIFLSQTKENFPRPEDLDRMTSFLGQFWAVVGITSLLFRTFASGRWVAHFGFLGSLLTLPFFVGVGALAIVSSGLLGAGTKVLFWIVVGFKFLERVFLAVYYPAHYTLYQPLSPERRDQIQTMGETVVAPIVGGLTGLLLLGLSNGLGFAPVGLAGTLILILGVWVAFSFVTNLEYRRMLNNALERRGLTGQDLKLDDPMSLQILQKGLASPRPEEALYCLKLIEEADPPGLPDILLRLLEHPDSDLRVGACQGIERLSIEEHLELLCARLKREEDPAVQGALLRAISSTAPTEAFDLLKSHLDSEEESVCRGALVGLIRYCGLEGAVEAGARLVGLEKSESGKERRLAANLLGDIGVTNFYRGVESLLRDKDPSVQEAALRAAERLNNSRLWPLVIECLAQSSLRETAIKTIVSCGDSALPSLEEAYEKADDSPQGRRRIVQAVGRIRTPAAIQFLVHRLHEADRNFLQEILWAIHFSGYQSRSDERARIDRLLQEEADFGRKILEARAALIGRAGPSMLRSAIEYELEKVQIRIFLLFSVTYPSASIMLIWSNFKEGSNEKKDIALELLDNTLKSDHKELALPILAPPSITSADTEEIVIETILTQPDTWANPWLLACTIHSAQFLSMDGKEELIQPYLDHPDRAVSEAAGAACLRDGHSDRDAVGEEASLTIIEKVQLLQKASIFTSIPDEILADIAQALKEIDIAAGKTLFEKGVIGTTMYITASGKMRVHDGEVTFAELPAGSIFGELAALDPEPRSASITPIEDSKLFEISQEALFELMRARAELAEGILQVLCTRLRELLAKGQSPPPKEESGQGQEEALTVKATEDDQLSIIERVIILSTCSIFTETSDAILSRIAELSRERRLKRNETLFHKGDLGTTMYMVVDGKIKVHDGDTLIVELGERAIVGEMAALSSEPRTASVTAVEDTVLLSLDQKSLQEIMRDQLDVMLGIIRVLIRRLRSMM